MIRNVLINAIVALCVSAVARAQPIIPDHPDYVVLQNSFNVVKAVGDYVVGMQDKALVVLEYGESDSTFHPINQEWLDEEVVDMKRFGDVLAIRCADDGSRGRHSHIRAVLLRRFRVCERKLVPVAVV